MVLNDQNPILYRSKKGWLGYAAATRMNTSSLPSEYGVAWLQ